MPAECYRFVVQGIAAGEQVQQVMHYIVENNDDATPIEMAGELCGLWDSTAKTQWLTFNSDFYAIRWIQAKRILPSGGNSFWMEYPESAAQGAIDAQIGVLQLAPILKLFAGLTEGVQGRIFLPPPAEGSIDANVISTTYSDEVLDWFDLAKELTDNHTFGLCVYSPKNNAAYVVTTATMSNILGCQGRRRKPM